MVLLRRLQRAEHAFYEESLPLSQRQALLPVVRTIRFAINLSSLDGNEARSIATRAEPINRDLPQCDSVLRRNLHPINGRKAGHVLGKDFLGQYTGKYLGLESECGV